MVALRAHCLVSLRQIGTSALGLGMLAACSATASAGGSPPQGLLGKSVIITWSESREMKDPDGGSRHRVVNAEYGIYISSAGRVFTQMGRNITNHRGKVVNSSGSSRGPDGDVIKTSNVRYSRSISFEGRSIHTDTKYESGARRITVAMGEGFNSCSANIILGKEDGAPGLVMHGMNTKLHMLTSVSISGTTCSVRQGAAVGGE